MVQVGKELLDNVCYITITITLPRIWPSKCLPVQSNNRNTRKGVKFVQS